MKILCLIDDLGSGGAQRQMVKLAIEMKKKGNDIEFLVYHPNDFYKDVLERNNINVTYINEGNYIKRILKIRKYIRKSNIECLIAFLESSCFMATLSGFPYKKWKLILGERSANPRILTSLKSRFFRIFHGFADYVVANSKANINLVKKANPFLSEAKLKVIYNAVHFDLGEPLEKDLDKEYFEIIVGASHRYVKNSILLVKAFSELDENIKNKFRIVWYGDRITDNYFDGSYLETKALVTKYSLEKFIEFRPATHDFIDKIRKSDIVALFSKHEGLPNVICEAMALSKPVICSNVSDIEVILNHNLNQVFKVNDIEELKKVFIFYSKLNHFQLKEIGNSNFKKSLELFDENIVINNYLKLIKL